MKLTLTYIFIMIVFFGNGQVLDSISYYYTIDKDSSQGKYSFDTKESGIIYQFRKLVYKSKNLSNSLVKNKENEFIFENQIAPLYSGELKDGVKVGKWSFYFDLGLEYCWEQIIATDYSITYKTDTIIYKKSGLTIIYVRDSMLVYGNIYSSYPYNYFIDFECTNKKECKYWYKRKENIIETSDYDKLDFILTRIDIGDYTRQIRYFQKEKNTSN